MKEIEMLFIKDLFQILMEQNAESKRKSKNDPIEMGKHLAYYDVLSTLYSQLIAFNINLSDVGMSGFDPDRDVL